jgi:acetolactate synthase-1/2/3 large subunit
VALGQADLILVVGAPLDFRLGFGEPPLFNEQAQVVYVDVDDFRKHRPAAAAVYGDLKAALGRLAEQARGRARQAWVDAVREKDRAARDKDRPLMDSDSTPIHPLRLLSELEAFCDPDAVLVGDGGDFVSFAGRLIHRREPGLWMDGGPFGCLGAGPGYAMAAKLLYPDRQVVLIAGDGAFGFSAIEVDTMVRHRLPIVIVLGNNGIWALEKHPMQNVMGMSVASDLRPGTRYDQLVEALGGHGELVERPEQIRPALERAFKSGVVACVNVILDPHAEYPRSSIPI